MATKKTCDGCGEEIKPKSDRGRIVALMIGNASQEAFELCEPCFDTTCAAVEVTIKNKPRPEWAGELAREPYADDATAAE